MQHFDKRTESRMRKHRRLLINRIKHPSIYPIIIRPKTSFQGLHKEHLKLRLIDILNRCIVLISMYLVDQLIGIVIFESPLLVEEDEHFRALEVSDQWHYSAWMGGYCER